MDDRAKVKQRQIYIEVRGVGTASECPVGAHLPAPPEGCESRQVIDHGAVVAIFCAAFFELPMKLRTVQAYADIWEIAIVRLGPDEFKAAVQSP